MAGGAHRDYRPWWFCALWSQLWCGVQNHGDPLPIVSSRWPEICLCGCNPPRAVCLPNDLMLVCLGKLHSVMSLCGRIDPSSSHSGPIQWWQVLGFTLNLV